METGHLGSPSEVQVSWMQTLSFPVKEKLTGWCNLSTELWRAGGWGDADKMQLFFLLVQCDCSQFFALLGKYNLFIGF